MKTLSKLRRSYYAAPLATALACAIAVLTFSPYQPVEKVGKFGPIGSI